MSNQPMAERTAGETEFIDQMSRKMMVELCDEAIRNPGKMTFAVEEANCHVVTQPYLEHMMSKGWVAKDGSRILAAGWATAARFLKR